MLLWELLSPFAGFCGYLPFQPNFRVKLCCLPSDPPLFCCRSYSSTSIEEAMKRGEDPPTPPPRPQKTHSRASSLDLNKVFQPSVPGEVFSAPQPFPFLLDSVDGCLPQRPLWDLAIAHSRKAFMLLWRSWEGRQLWAHRYSHVPGTLPTLAVDQELWNSLPRG